MMNERRLIFSLSFIIAGPTFPRRLFFYTLLQQMKGNMMRLTRISVFLLITLLALTLACGPAPAPPPPGGGPGPANSPAAKSSTTSAEDAGALIYAASEGDIEKVKELLDEGVDVNSRGHDGRTALMEAAYAGHKEMAKLLLDKGANFGMKKNDGATPLSFAQGGKFTEIINMINQAADLINASSKGDAKAVQDLLNKGASINAQGEDGRTALMEAVYGGHAEVVQILLDKGANPNTKKNDGATALSFAEGAKNQKIIEMLKQKGAK
jgi:ankyrin repeat protein